MILVLFYVWEDAGAWAYWNYSFDMHLNYLGSLYCFSPVPFSTHLWGNSGGWWLCGHNIFCLLLFSCSLVSDSVTPWTAACQPSLSFTISWSLLKLTFESRMSTESMMPSNHLILCHPFLLLPSTSPWKASGSFPMSWLFTSGGQSIGASASVFPMNIQDRFPLGFTGLISLLSKGLSEMVFLVHKYISQTWVL